jgi:hypothetical protein
MKAFKPFSTAWGWGMGGLAQQAVAVLGYLFPEGPTAITGKRRSHSDETAENSPMKWIARYRRYCHDFPRPVSVE